MYTIDGCPCCESKQLKLLPAIVSPFLAKYAVGTDPFLCSLAECEACFFRFFDSRLTPVEVQRLYSGYRNEEYFSVRHNVEPWYSKKVNTGIGNDPEEIQRRNAALEEFLNRYIDMAEVDTVLDFGGDKGQFIPASLGKQKFVYELSDAAPLDGVTRIVSYAELQERRFDFLMLTGVLEHCSEPLEVLQTLGSLAKGPDTYFLIGVPYERFNVKLLGTGRLYRAYLNLLRRSGFLLKLVDFYSAVGRVRCNLIPPLGIVKCHEHLNFFHEKSMEALLRRAGMEIIGSSITQTNTYPARTLSLNVLARPRNH